MSGVFSKWRLHNLKWTSLTCFLILGQVLSQNDCRRKTTELVADRTVRHLYFPSRWSDKYPENYCQNWRISSPDGWVRLYMFELDLEYAADCGFDNLTIYSEGDGRMQKLKTMCGIEPSPFRSITSPSKSVVLEFKSDSSQEGKGFHIAYVNVEEGDDVETLPATAEDQYLTYPTSGKYPSNANITWRIDTLSPGQKLKIYVETMNIENESNCSYDSLAIYDGYDLHARLLDKLCGRLDTPHIWFTSSSQYLFLNFISDDMFELDGFKIMYTYDNKVDVINLAATENVQTLKYPSSSNYPSNANVKWRIAAVSRKQKVKIYVKQLRLEYEKDCLYDSLDIYDGFDETAEHKKKLCGYHHNHVTLISSSQFFFLHFTSDGTRQFSGFTIQYSIDNSETMCRSDETYVIPLIATDEDNELLSPNYPSSYPNDCMVVWRIRSDQEYVKFTVDVLDIEYDRDCKNDALIFYDGFDDSDPILRKLCNIYMSSGQTFFSSSRYVYVRFATNGNIGGHGFRISFKAEDGYVSNYGEAESSNRPALVGAIIGAICFVLPIIGFVVFMVRRRKYLQQQRQRSRQHPGISSPTPAHSTGNSEGVYMVSPTAPPAYASLNHAYVHEEPPPSYSEASLYTIEPSATPIYSNSTIGNVTAGLTTPATLSAEDAMAAFKEYDDHIYTNGAALELNSQNQEISPSQDANSGQEPPPDYQHPPQ